MTTLKRRACRIPDELAAATLAQCKATNPATGRTYTLREVSAWLASEHGVTASREAVRRLYHQAAERDEQLLVAALREQLRDAVAPLLMRVRRASRRLDAALASNTDPKALASGLRAATGALTAVAQLSGVAKPVSLDVTSGGQPLHDARAALAEGLARAALATAAGATGEAPREPVSGDG